jgi:sugar lactone lactonase YvrE
MRTRARAADRRRIIRKAPRRKARPFLETLEDRTLLSAGALMDLLQQGIIGPTPTPDQLQILSSDPSSQALTIPPLASVSIAAALPPINSPLDAIRSKTAPDPALLSGDDEGPAAGPGFANGDPSSRNLFAGSPASPSSGRQAVTIPGGNVLVNNPTADGAYSGFTQSETTNLVFGNTIVVGYNDSESFSYNGAQSKFTGFSVSTDGGNTFTDEGALPTNPNGDLGDPVLARDNATGTIYFATLAYGSFYGNPAIQVFRSTDGINYQAPVNAAPGLPSYHFPDKDWITVDNFAGAGQHNVYVTYTDFGGGTRIVLSTSTDGGTTWGPNGGTTIATGTLQGSNVIVGPDHSVNVFWLDGNGSSERILMRRSIDQGATFAPAVTVATLTTRGSEGDLGLGFRTNAFPSVAVNPVNGDLYVAYNDRAGSDRGNIYFTQSSDGGATWSAPVQVNDDATTNDQWQPAIAVKPNGTQLFLGWYDRRLDTGNAMIDTYGAVAKINPTTHAVSFQPNFRITDQSFPAVYGRDSYANYYYMGDYDTASADNTNFYYTWGDNRLVGAGGFNQPDVRFARILTDFEVTSTSPGAGDFVSSKPTDFVVRFNDAYLASSVIANDLTVNGITANTVTQTDANTLTFHFNTSPVTHEGPQTIALAAGSITRLANGDPLQAYSATFYYDTLRLQVASTGPAAGSAINLPGHLVLHFYEAVAASSISTSNLVLSAGTVTAAAAVAGDPTSVDYTISGPASLDGKTLTVTLPAGTLLDTDGNPGLGFSAGYAANILVSPYPTPLTPDAPAGSLIYDPSVSATIGFAGDTDSFTISLDAGQTVSVAVTPDAALQPGVALIGTDGTTVVASATASGPGAAAVLQTIPTATAGTYTVRVSGASSTTGAFTVRLTLNAALQNELYGVTSAGSDDTIVGAQDLSGAFVDLGGGASRAAVLGKVPGGAVTGDVWVVTRTGTIGGNLLLLDNAGNRLKQISNPAFATGVLSDVELGPDNSVYVALDVSANSANGEILRFDAGGNLLATIHLPPDGAFSFNFYYPFGFDVAADGSLWVPQPNTHNVIHTDASGNLLASYSVGGVPEDVAVRADGQVFVANTGLGSVQRIDPGSGTVSVFATGITSPLGLNFTPGGDLWVSDVNLGVRRFDSGGHQVQFIAASGVIDPQVDPAGNLFVTHPGIGTVDKYDSSGNLLARTSVGTAIGLAVVGVDAPPPPLPDLSDYYSFSLTAGQTATVALTNLASAQASLDLEDVSGNLLALGRTVDTNVHQVVSNFVARTMGTYYVHITGNGAPYSLVVTRNADFDTENNHTLTTAQDVSGIGNVLGEVTQGSRPVTVPPDRENAYGNNSNAYPFSLGFFGVASQRYQQLYAASAFSSGGTINQIRFRRDSAPFSTTNINVQISLGYAATTVSTASTTYANNIGAGYVTVFDGLLSLSSSGVGNPNPFDIVINVNPLFTYDPSKGDLLLDIRMRNSPSTAFFDAEAFDSRVVRIYNFDVNAPTGTKDFTNYGLVTQFGMQDYKQDTYQLSVNAGDHLTVSTRTPAGDPQAPFEPHNLLDPRVQLFDPSGTLVASDDNSGPDGKNASLSYTALATGTYRVQITGANFSVGDYVLSVTGATGVLPSFDVTSTNPPANALLRSIPSITVDFNDSLYLGGLTASALTVDGMAATGFTVNNDHEVTWFLPALSGVGDQVPHTIAIAAGALTNIHGKPIDSFSETIYVDNAPPRVIATSVEEGDILAPGTLTYTVTFSEPLLRSSVTAASFDLLGDFRNVHYAPLSFSLDATNTVLTLNFPVLPDDRYTLTLFSKGFQDRVLFYLDGEPHTPRPPSIPSGDGVEGGNFFVDFFLDFATAPYPTPLGAENPLGSLIYDPTVTNVISYACDTHSYTLNLDPGQTLTAAVTAGATLQPTITLSDPTNTVIGTVSAAAAGKDAVLQTIPITQGGTYTVTVGGAAGSMGLYTTQLVLNAAVENEMHGGPSDDTIAGAQDLSGSFLNLGVGGSRGAVLGQLRDQLPAGSVLVNERGVNDIAVFDNAGNLVRKITNSALQGGVLSSVQLGPDNTIYAGLDTNPGGGHGGKILHLDVSGNLLDTIRLPDDYGYGFYYPFGFDVAPDGTLWVPKPNSAHVIHIDRSGNVLRDYGVGGSALEDAAVRADGQVFLTDTNNGRVLQLDPASGAVSRFASVGVPIGVSFAAAGGNGDLLVSDYYSGVRFFNSSGVQDKLIAAYLANHAEVDASGNLFVPSFSSDNLRKFDAAGNLLFSKSLDGNPTHLSVVGVDAPLPPPPDLSDFYSFTLTAGQSATIAVKGLDPTPVHVDLEDVSGHILALGNPVATSVDEVIDRYIAPSSGTYYVHVTGTGGRYSVVVTRGAAFGVEYNGDAAHAQDVSNTSGVLAALTRPPTVAVGVNFDGLSADDNPYSISPPDTTAAVGPSQVIEATNLALRISDKAGSNLLTQQFDTLFASLGTHYLTDPQVVYDDIANRWYVAILDIDYSFYFSDVLFAVSKDANPLDGWAEMQRIHVGSSDFLDFDKLGFNANAVVITANDFINGYYLNSLQVIAIDKSTILDGKNSTFKDYISQRDTSHFRAMVPARMHGARSSDPMYFVEEAGHDNGSAARVVTVPNILTSSPSFLDTDIPVAPYGSPPPALQPFGSVNTNDTTFTQADWRGGLLVSAQTVSEPDDGYSTARVR